MKNNTLFPLYLACFVTLALSSCEKVIDVKLRNASGKINIEANYTNVPGIQVIYLRANIPFTSTNVYPPITGALVTISDQDGNKYPFFETAAGTYTAANVAGLPLNTYQLTVNTKGDVYTAKSTMPEVVNLDSLLAKNDLFGGSKHKQRISVMFQDPKGISNQYRFVLYVNGVQVKRIFAFDDEFTDGKTNTTELDQDDIDIYAGDTVKVEMQCLDLPLYTYWLTLSQQGDRGPAGSVAPANPPTNLSNNALGYFSAHTSQIKTIVIK